MDTIGGRDNFLMDTVNVYFLKGLMIMTFTQWLKTQIDRDDPIGDVARDAAMDTRRKPHQNTLMAWQTFLSSAGAAAVAQQALIEAWDEYDASK